MSIVETVSPERAAGKVAGVYAAIHQAMGRVPNGIRLFSSSPDLLEQMAAQNGYYMKHPSLGFALLAMIRMLVSLENDCAYCVGMNESMLMHHAGFTPGQISEAKQDPSRAALCERDLAMLLFVLKATDAPKSVAGADLDRLRALGWTDGDIVDALYHGARNRAIDIMFDALKVVSDF